MNKTRRFLSNRFLRIHLIVIYLLLLGCTVAWTLFYLYLTRIIQAQSHDYHRIEQRLRLLESKLITITAVNHDEVDFIDRQARFTKVKSDEILSGSIHFQVPVSIEHSASSFIILVFLVACSHECFLWKIG